MEELLTKYLGLWASMWFVAIFLIVLAVVISILIIKGSYSFIMILLKDLMKADDVAETLASTKVGAGIILLILSGFFG